MELLGFFINQPSPQVFVTGSWVRKNVSLFFVTVCTNQLDLKLWANRYLWAPCFMAEKYTSELFFLSKYKQT